MNKGLNRYYAFIARGERGSCDDVDFLMHVLVSDPGLATVKLVDFALGLVRSSAGKTRIEHYLFEGNQMQRNYAALFFKRRGETSLLQKAVDAGLVDTEQAFSQ